MTDNKYFWTLLHQSWAVSYPLAHKRSSMWSSVVAVSTILLALSVSLVSFSTARGTVLPPSGKTWLLQNNFSAHVRPERTKYARLQKSGCARTVLMTQFASRALYAVPRVRVKSEVYFGLDSGCSLFFRGSNGVSKVCFDCSLHFGDECFINKAQFDGGFAHRLILKDGAVSAIKHPSHDSEPQAVSKNALNFCVLSAIVPIMCP